MFKERIKEKTLPWGAKLYVSNFPAHGAVSIMGSIAGGSQLAQSDELAKVHASMLLEGTRKHSKKELQILLDEMGASLSFAAGSERLSFNARVRLPHAEKLLALIAEILLEPLFPQQELVMLKKREEANLALEAQDTRAQAQINIMRLMYPKGHPNYDETTAESKKSFKTITTTSLREFHNKILSRKTLIVSAAGDIAPTRLVSLVDKYFKVLPNKNISLPRYKKARVTVAKKAAIIIKHKAGIDYMVGIATGITKSHPSYAALMLGIQMLGNPGFVGRLMQTVREKESLTYVAYSYMSGFDHKKDGNVLVWTNFPPQSFVQGRASIMREIRKIAEEGVSDEEVQKHRDLYYNHTRVQMSNSIAFARAAHQIGVEGRKTSYLDEFPKAVLKLTAKEVNRALKKYLIPSKLCESAAGPVEKNALKA